MNKYNYNNLSPFKWYVIQNFPFIEADFDAITEYQLLCKIVEYLNKTIDSTNNIGNQMENITNAFIELQNYVDNFFDDLNIQNEINNKLNEMAEDGSLLEVITPYIQFEEQQRISADNNLQQQINNLSSGSPKGTYTNINDLITANPPSGVYIIQSNGHIYSWTHDGQNPIDLGDYQSSGIADYSVTPIKTSFFKNSSNLIYKWIIGIGLYSSTGLEYENSIMCVSNKFEIDNEKYLCFMVNEVFSGYLYRIFYYDSSNNFISSSAFTNAFQGTIATITPVNNSKYARIQLTNNNTGAENCQNPAYYMCNIIENTNALDSYIEPLLFDNNYKEKTKINISNFDELLKPLFNTSGQNEELSFTSGYIHSYKTRQSVQANGYSYATINVNENEIYKIEGYSYFQGKLFYFYDINNMLIDYFPKTYQGSHYDTVIVTIPSNVSQMYINSLNSNPTKVTKINKITLNSEMSSKLYGKKLSVNGDSIVEGSANNNISFATLIANKYNMNLQNIAVGGATIATGTYWQDGTTPRHYISTTISNMDTDSDYIIVAGGVNDYWNEVPLGEITIYTNSTIDNTTFYGAMEELCRNLLNRFPTKKIGFLIYHKINRIFINENEINLTFNSYYEATKKVLEKYSIPYLDLSKLSCLNTEITSFKENFTCNEDGVHPNTNGYNYFYNDKIISWLENL